MSFAFTLATYFFTLLLSFWYFFYDDQINIYKYVLFFFFFTTMCFITSLWQFGCCWLYSIRVWLQVEVIVKIFVVSGANQNIQLLIGLNLPEQRTHQLEQSSTIRRWHQPIRIYSLNIIPVHQLTLFYTTGQLFY